MQLKSIHRLKTYIESKLIATLIVSLVGYCLHNSILKIVYNVTMKNTTNHTIVKQNITNYTNAKYTSANTSE